MMPRLEVQASIRSLTVAAPCRGEQVIGVVRSNRRWNRLRHQSKQENK